MKAKASRYSVIIVSGGATSTNREFSISSRLVRNSIIIFIALLLVSGYIIFDYLNTSLNKEKLKRLDKENIEKAAALNQLINTLLEKENRLDQMALFKDKILVVIGLNSLENMKDVGSGGGGDEPDSGSIPAVPGVVEVPGKELNNQHQADQLMGKNVLKKSEDILKKTNHIHNDLKFVENAVEEQKARLEATPYTWPTKGYLTSAFGWRIHPLTGSRHFHYGLDIASQYGNKVTATGSGVVLEAGHWDYLGNLIVIDHGFGFTTRYGHLAAMTVKAGDRVKRYQVIGYVGNSGRSWAPHLHYEVRYLDKPLNPMNFIID
ncbi:MAG: M23 family metallopeptidase [Candidatus Aminicenantes bacterium]